MDKTPTVYTKYEHPQKDFVEEAVKHSNKDVAPSKYHSIDYERACLSATIATVPKKFVHPSGPAPHDYKLE